MPRLTRQIALRSTLFASLILLIAAFLGESVLSSYGIPLPVLALSGGIILFLVALGHVLREFAPPTPPRETTSEPAPAATLNMALSPLAFPTIVTPYGIAALIVFLALSPDLQARLVVGAILLAIMLLNLIVMLVGPAHAAVDGRVAAGPGRSSRRHSGRTGTANHPHLGQGDGDIVRMPFHALSRDTRAERRACTEELRQRP